TPRVTRMVRTKLRRVPRGSSVGGYINFGNVGLPRPGSTMNMESASFNRRSLGWSGNDRLHTEAGYCVGFIGTNGAAGFNRMIGKPIARLHEVALEFLCDQINL